MDESRILKAALWYEQQGFSVIPVRPDKKPMIRWEPYQHQRADEAQIRSWWQKWPEAMVGVVTGEISNLLVVDCDTAEGITAVEECIPDSLAVPTVTSPSGGRHYYFKHVEGLPNRARVLDGVDIRTTGGYIIAPPSKNGKGSYAWLPDCKISEVPPPALPESLYIKMQTSLRSLGGSTIGGDFQRLPLTSGDFQEGERDQALFHLANCLFKGGMPEENIVKYLLFFAKNCTPPFPEKEVLLKFESAKKRNESGEINIAQEVRDFVVTSSGFFLTSECFQRLPVTSNRRERKAVVLELLKLCKKGEIERHPTKNGCYRKIEGDLERMDFMSATTETLDLWLPFKLHELVETMPGNTILLSGEPNAGKTGLLLNIIRYNQDRFEIHYFNSEMGASELKKRLEKFEDMPLSGWKFHAWER